MIWWDRESSVSMAHDDVLDNSWAFGQSHRRRNGGVVDDRRGFEGVQLGKVRWGEERAALVEFEFVGDVEFFAEPEDAFGLGVLEVVDCEGHGWWWVLVYCVWYVVCSMY